MKCSFIHSLIAIIFILFFSLESDIKAESCYDLGYRYGLCSAKSMHGLPCKQENDIIMPERCRDLEETQKGINEGVKIVYDVLNLDREKLKSSSPNNKYENLYKLDTFDTSKTDVLGIKLGMTLQEFKSKYPTINIEEYKEDNITVWYDKASLFEKGSYEMKEYQNIEGWNIYTLKFTPEKFGTKLVELNISRIMETKFDDKFFKKLKEKYGNPNCNGTNERLSYDNWCWGECSKINNSYCEAKGMALIFTSFGYRIDFSLENRDLIHTLYKRKEDITLERKKRSTGEIKF